MSNSSSVPSALTCALDSLDRRFRVHDLINNVAGFAVAAFFVCIFVAIIAQGNNLLILFCYLSFSFAVFSRVLLALDNLCLIKSIRMFHDDWKTWKGCDCMQEFEEKWKESLSPEGDLHSNEIDSVLGFTFFVFFSFFIPKLAILASVLIVLLSVIGVRSNSAQNLHNLVSMCKAQA